MGRCNCDCYYCLGKDLPARSSPSLYTPHTAWPDFNIFLQRCADLNLRKLYLTGLDTDPLLYQHLADLITALQADRRGFDVGLRTNGFALYGAAGPSLMNTINTCREEIGYSVLSLRPTTQKMICGVSHVPDWLDIITRTKPPCRVSIVVNRCNQHEILEIIRHLAPLHPTYLNYIQLRRVCTETRLHDLWPDIHAYEQVYTQLYQTFPVQGRLWGDADVFQIDDIPVVCWRTTKTTINSINYFTDGTFSEDYFIIEGYQRAHP